MKMFDDYAAASRFVAMRISSESTNVHSIAKLLDAEMIASLNHYETVESFVAYLRTLKPEDADYWAQVYQRIGLTCPAESSQPERNEQSLVSQLLEERDTQLARMPPVTIATRDIDLLDQCAAGRDQPIPGRHPNKEKPRRSGVPVTARNGMRSEAELGADVDRLAVLRPRSSAADQPVMLLRIAQPGGDIEVARQAIARRRGRPTARRALRASAA